MVAGVLLAFFEVLGFDDALLLRDHQLVFWPRWWAIRDSVLMGELPALTTGGQGGIPIDQLLNGTFTPGALVLLLGPFEVVYDLLVVFHFALLAIGALLLARRLGAPVAAAIAASAVVTFAGPSISTESLVVALIGFAYTPWVLLGWLAILREPNRRSVAILALAIGFQLQAIIPPVLLIDVVGAIAIAVFLRVRPHPRMIGAGIFAGLLGIGIASLELFGALEGLSGTGRGSGFAYEESSGWAVGPAALLEYLVPTFWAPPDVPYLNPGAVTGNANDPPYFPSLYLGTAVPLLILGATTKRGRWVALLFVFFGLVAMGRHTPLHRIVAALPILSSSRYAVKYTLLVAASASALVAFGVVAAAQAPRRFRAVAAAYAVVVIGVLVMVTSEGWRELLTELHAYGAQRWRLDLAEVVEVARAAGIARAVHAAFAAVLLLGVAHLMCRRSDARTAETIALVVLFDLAVAATYVVVGLDVQRSTVAAPIVEVLRDPAPAHYFVESATVGVDLSRTPPNEAVARVIESYAQRGELQVPGARRFQDQQLDASSNPYHAAMSRLAERLPPSSRDRLLVRAGVATLLTQRRDVPYEPVAEGASLYAYALPASPYVTGYHRFVAFDPATWPLRRFAKFFEDPSNVDIALVNGGPRTSTTCAGRPDIEWRTAGPNGPVDAVVDAECPAVVVLHEVLRRGFVATVDDREVPLYEVDAGYVGALVPAGRHAVRFSYESLVGQWAPLSAASLFVALVLFVRRRDQ